jgi:hypothetical protein
LGLERALDAASALRFQQPGHARSALVASAQIPEHRRAWRRRRVGFSFTVSVHARQPNLRGSAHHPV